LKKEVDEHLKAEKENALKKVTYLQNRMRSMDEYAKLSDQQRAEIDLSFETIEEVIRGQNLVAVIRDQTGRYETGEYSRLLTKVSGWAKGGTDIQVEYVSQSELEVKFNKAYLADDEDINVYLEALRIAMVKAIKANKRIQL
jgi:hypothetical protein